MIKIFKNFKDWNDAVISRDELTVTTVLDTKHKKVMPEAVLLHAHITDTNDGEKFSAGLFDLLKGEGFLADSDVEFETVRSILNTFEGND